ncbi:MAG: hypothetical protein WAW63_02210 [Candidatus Saccharimonadales bacterium]
MDKTIYLVDNMVICSKIAAPYVGSTFFMENVWIIDEVIYEARNSRSIKSIKKLQHHLEARECERLKQIALDCFVKYKILKLYEGCADALLLATALAINDIEGDQTELRFGNITPIIVTEEKDIRDACEDLQIKCISKASLISIVKHASTIELALGV